MKKYLLLSLISCGFIFALQGMENEKPLEDVNNEEQKAQGPDIHNNPDAFDEACAKAHDTYQKNESERFEKERKKNEDIEGLTKYTLSELGFKLRKKYRNDAFAESFIGAIQIYQKEKRGGLIDIHLNKFAIVQDFVHRKMNKSEDLCGLMSDVGFFGKFQGKYNDLLATLLRNCKPVDVGNETRFDTNNLLKGTGLFTKYQVFGYTALGFVAAIPCCYAFFNKFCK